MNQVPNTSYTKCQVYLKRDTYIKMQILDSHISKCKWNFGWTAHRACSLDTDMRMQNLTHNYWATILLGTPVLLLFSAMIQSTNHVKASQCIKSCRKRSPVYVHIITIRMGENYFHDFDCLMVKFSVIKTDL